MLTDQQRTAITNLCRMPEETADPMFKRINGDLSVILTIDAGYA